MLKIRFLLLFAAVLTLVVVYFTWNDLKAFPAAPSPRLGNSVIQAQESFLAAAARRGHRGNIRTISSLPAKECKDPLCMEFLTKTERTTFEECQKKATRKMKHFLNLPQENHIILARNRSGVMMSGRCRFMNATGRSPVGLVSFAGSGNTWVRGLLEQVTGICTGAAYCDSTLRFGGFDGEGLQSTSVIAVKTHSTRPTWSRELNHLEFGGSKNRLHFDSVILVLRNPFHALVSEFNRQLNYKSRTTSTGLAHVAVNGPEFFGEYYLWDRFINSHLERWKSHFDWLIERPIHHLLLVVRYEDLKKDLTTEVGRMMKFLHFEIDDAELSERLKTELQLFHRKSSGRDFDHFTYDQRILINKAIFDIVEDLKDKFGRTYGVEEYFI